MGKRIEKSGTNLPKGPELQFLLARRKRQTDASQRFRCSRASGLHNIEHRRIQFAAN